MKYTNEANNFSGVVIGSLIHFGYRPGRFSRPLRLQCDFQPISLGRSALPSKSYLKASEIFHATRYAIQHSCQISHSYHALQMTSEQHAPGKCTQDQTSYSMLRLGYHLKRYKPFKQTSVSIYVHRGGMCDGSENTGVAIANDHG